MIWVASSDSHSYGGSLLAFDDKLDIVVFQQNTTAGAYYGVHDEIPFSLILNSRPSYNINSTSNYTFTATSSQAHDLSNQALDEHSLTLESKANYNLQLSSQSQTFRILESQSYIISMPDNFTHNFTLNVGENYTENISLPCSIDTYNSLTYRTYDNGVDIIPPWIEPDFDQFILDIRVPDTNQASNHTYMVESTYASETVINYFYIFIIE